jgi:hypothetical protein
MKMKMSIYKDRGCYKKGNQQKLSNIPNHHHQKDKKEASKRILKVRHQTRNDKTIHTTNHLCRESIVLAFVKNGKLHLQNLFCLTFAIRADNFKRNTKSLEF